MTTLRFLAALGILTLFVVAPGARADVPLDPPTEFELSITGPNPFCGATTIQLVMPERTEVVMRILNLDQTEVVRVLYDSGQLEVGVHSFLWDGKDQTGNDLPDGTYWIAVTAGGSTPLFEGEEMLTIQCSVANEPKGWGSLKARFQ